MHQAGEYMISGKPASRSALLFTPPCFLVITLPLSQAPIRATLPVPCWETEHQTCFSWECGTEKKLPATMEIPLKEATSLLFHGHDVF